MKNPQNSVYGKIADVARYSSQAVTLGLFEVFGRLDSGGFHQLGQANLNEK